MEFIENEILNSTTTLTDGSSEQVSPNSMTDKEILEKVATITAKVMYQIAEEIGKGDTAKGFNAIADTLQRTGCPILPDCFWDNERGVVDKKTAAYISKFNKRFYGYAYCAPKDEENFNEFIGEQIAAGRAEIKFYQYLIKEVLKPKHKILKHTAHVIKHGPSAHSYVAKMACRQFSLIEKDIHNMRKLIEANRIIINILSDMNNLVNMEVNI